MNQTAIKMKMFVVRNKTAIVVAVAATAVIAIQQKGLKQHNDFLTEKGLYTEFYEQED